MSINNNKIQDNSSIYLFILSLFSKFPILQSLNY